MNPQKKKKWITERERERERERENFYFSMVNILAQRPIVMSAIAKLIL